MGSRGEKRQISIWSTWFSGIHNPSWAQPCGELWQGSHCMCSIPPQTPLNPLRLLWLALLLLVYWSTLGDKEEGPAWKGVPSPLPLSPSFILSSVWTWVHWLWTCLNQQNLPVWPLMLRFHVNICAQPLNAEEGPDAPFSPLSFITVSALFNVISDAWGVLWNHADKMVKSKIYLISGGNPHRFVYLRLHGHLAILYF